MTQQEDSKKTVIIIGAGPGGYPAAFRAADLGFDVTLIDKREWPGGVCLHHGCIPTKALLHTERVLAETQALATCGVSFSPPSIDVEQLRTWKEGVTKKLAAGVVALCKRRKIALIQASAQLLSNHQVELTYPDGHTHTLSADYIIIATGSEPIEIPGIPTDGSRIMNSKSALELADIPARLLVVGGGYIGIELGSVYAALGAKVTVVEMMPQLLPGVDRSLVTPLSRELSSRFDQILLKTSIKEAKADGDAVRVLLNGPEGEASMSFDRILISIGRKPVTRDLGLDHAGIKVDARGFIEVNENGETNVPSIFAIGDVAGNPMLAHKATFEGIQVAEFIAGIQRKMPARIIPAVVFTTPEIAWCGITEQEAKAEKRNVKICRFPWSASGRALTMGAGNGLTRLIIDKDTTEILGVGITGIGAGELIGEGILAVQQHLKAEDLASTIHPHPTLSETMMEAADVFLGSALHIYR